MLKQGQPRGFSVFFLTEMWERYGFYILQTLMVFYLLQQVHLLDSEAYVIVGSFTALAYINSIFGGFIADKLIGYTGSVILGAIILCFGYAILGVAHNEKILLIALAVVSVGTGILKPNISSMLSVLYTKNDSRKETGYTLFYVGVYVGAICGSLLGGYIQKYFGWGSVYASATVGLFIALCTFSYSVRKLKLKDTRFQHINIANYIGAILSVILLIFVAYNVLINEFLSLLYFVIIGLFSFGFVLFCIFKHHGQQRLKLLAFLILTLFSVVYWAIYFQQFFSISLATIRVSDLQGLPASAMPAIVSFGVIIFGPLMNMLWIWLRQRNKDLSIPAKFSLSFLLNSLSFLVLSFSLWIALKTNSHQYIYFIVIAYLLIAIGELCISPIGLAMVSTLVPERLTGAMMGIFLLSIGFGGKLAGVLATNSAIDVKLESLAEMERIYLNAFNVYFVFSLLTFIVALIVTPFIRRLINPKN